MFLLILIIPLWINSQTITIGNLYTSNKYTINPAYAGGLNYLDAFIDYRSTAASVEGSPTLITFGADMPVYRKMSLGARFYKQSEGLFDVINGFADYSYWLEIAKGHFLRFGISLGIRSNQMNYSKIVADDPSAIIDVASRNFVGVSFQSSAGFVYQWKNLEWSLSVPQLFESKNLIKPAYQSLFIYKVQLRNQNISLKPSLFVNYKNNTPVLYDINLQTYWKDQFWLGLGYRNRPGILASAGFRINQLNIAYAIELGAEKYSNMFKQVHEISISYSFQKKKKMPMDTIFVPYNQIVVQNDSAKIDTTIKNINVKKEIVEADNSEKTDTLATNDHKESIYKIVDAGEGIYVIRSATNDSTNFDLNEEFSDIEVDSMTAHHLVHQIENKENENKINIEDEGSGVYTIKANPPSIDSLSKSTKITDQELDSLMKTDVLINRMFAKKEVKSTVELSDFSAYYTIQLFINNSNKYLLSNSEIVCEARIEKNMDGEINYFYGYFNTEEEALKIAENFSKYKDLKIKILQINLNQ